ncbi:beta-galactosidase [Microbacterium sp. cf046]|uniref:beta-galactosidase n=1 Tax=Microbacterium sp. cf046 TaxID=1761803 RepID=UPI0015876AA0|nr:beta-galactosidase [Microbacterium sp. cf046]
MSNATNPHSRVRLTSRWIEIDGKPALPVTGELHFSRIPRGRWEETLRLMVASGLTSVSTYVFWIHHEPVRGEVSFEGDLDIAAFLETAERVGVDVIVRIGPWCHGEVRNGGHPDWVVEAAPDARTNDPVYLELAKAWYEQVAAQVAPFCGPDRRVIGIQIENELYDQPEHIATLKQLARDAGLSAPLWTATGWGGAILPPHEVFPLYSGYADGFWAGQGSTWDDSFRDHFRFTHVWDDPGVGGDFREEGVEIVVRDIDPEFPPATCELGGGMATAYHRRPIARGRDIAAVANVKIGNGSAWQGFYMYVGGTNPADHIQESHASGYPNDLPRFDYDFQAAFGATGHPGSSLGLLRDHNAFLDAFGDRLVQMHSSLPDDAPVDVHDLTSLRWAVRTDGESGFLFINTHQPHEPLSGSPDVQFQIALSGGDVIVPDRPVGIPSGVIARWPLRLDFAGVRFEWATASVAGVAGGAIPTVVLRAHDGIAPRVRFAAGTSLRNSAGDDVFAEEAVDIEPGTSVVANGALRILVVDERQAERLWYLGEELIDSLDPVWLEGEGLVVRAAHQPDAARWTGIRFEPVHFVTSSTPGSVRVTAQPIRAGERPPVRFGEFMGRSTAPTDAQIDEVAAVWRIDAPSIDTTADGDRAELVIEWEGDVAQLRAGGVVIRDRFWDGLPWRIDLTDLPPHAELTLHIVPITPESLIDLDGEARARVAADSLLCGVRNITRVISTRWTRAATRDDAAAGEFEIVGVG